MVDYLVKPVALDRFIKACNKANEWYNLRNQKTDQAPTAPGYFFVNVDYSSAEDRLRRYPLD